MDNVKKIKRTGYFRRRVEKYKSVDSSASASVANANSASTSTSVSTSVTSGTAVYYEEEGTAEIELSDSSSDSDCQASIYRVTGKAIHSLKGVKVELICSHLSHMTPCPKLVHFQVIRDLSIF